MDTYDEKIKFSLLSILIKYAKWKLHIIYKCEKGQTLLCDTRTNQIGQIIVMCYQLIVFII